MTFESDGIKALVERVFGKYLNDDFYTAWDSNGFCIATKNPIITELFSTIHKQFFNDNIYCMTLKNSCGWFGGGLTLLIADLVSDEDKREVIENGKEAFQVKKNFEKSKIEEKIKNAGLRYFALNPYSKKEKPFAFKNKNTKYDFIMSLNPCNQNENNSGWFCRGINRMDKGEGSCSKVGQILS